MIALHIAACTKADGNIFLAINIFAGFVANHDMRAVNVGRITHHALARFFTDNYGVHNIRFGIMTNGNNIARIRLRATADGNPLTADSLRACADGNSFRRRGSCAITNGQCICINGIRIRANGQSVAFLCMSAIADSHCSCTLIINIGIRTDSHGIC